MYDELILSKKYIQSLLIIIKKIVKNIKTFNENNILKILGEI
jgi:hypothetical protein